MKGGKAMVYMLLPILLLSMALRGEVHTFDVYYLPLEAEFYVPPTEEYIEKNGLHLKMTSEFLTLLFSEIRQENAERAQSDDYKILRIKIVDNATKQSVFITAERQILSEGKKYRIQQKLINDALNEILSAVKQHEKK